MKKLLSLFVLLLSWSVILVNGQTYHSKLPKFVFGSWKIYKFVKKGGTLLKPDEVNSFIGKKITFKKRAFINEPSTLFFDNQCSFRKYQFETIIPEEYVINEQLKGTLWWDGVEGHQEHKVQFVKVYCSKDANYYFEVANKKELAIYYDGYNFFLRKL